MRLLTAAVFSTFVLMGCASLSAPTPASSLSEAVQSATLATQTVDLYVQNGKINKADLLKIQQANMTLHAALNALEIAQSNGTPLQFASFNAAVAAFNSYMGK